MTHQQLYSRNPGERRQSAGFHPVIEACHQAATFSHHKDPQHAQIPPGIPVQRRAPHTSVELNQAQLPLHEAAMHLLQLHFGDAENSLIMPTADATPEQILEQVERVGLTRIKVADQSS